MTALAAEFFTLDEVNRLKIIQDVIDRRLTTQMAAQRLGISDRQCRRLLARYREDGPLGMTSRVSKSLTVQYDKVLYLIEDNEFSRRAIGKHLSIIKPSVLQRSKSQAFIIHSLNTTCRRLPPLKRTPLNKEDWKRLPVKLHHFNEAPIKDVFVNFD